MPVSVVVGGQYGSEGKGKVAKYFAEKLGASIAVRVGGPNSGHTAIDASGKAHIFRHLPTAALLPDITLVLPAGSYIVPEIVLREIAAVNLEKSRLVIDPHAMIVTSEDIASEKRGHLNDLIGSTGSGTGAAVMRRISRHHSVTLAKDDARLREFVKPASPLLRQALSDNQRVIIEGTQGFGLSVLHSPHYPFATSRDTTGAAFVAEAGLSPLDVDDVILVIRAFPIRVGGNSGPLENETDWSHISSISGSEYELIEYTSVTNKVRRVGLFDSQVVEQAIRANKPTRIVLNHLDYVDAMCARMRSLTHATEAFVRKVESSIAHKLRFVGIDPQTVIERDSETHTVSSSSIRYSGEE
jgi:adenylosuccinate synthase